MSVGLGFYGRPHPRLFLGGLTSRDRSGSRPLSVLFRTTSSPDNLHFLPSILRSSCSGRDFLWMFFVPFTGTIEQTISIKWSPERLGRVFASPNPSSTAASRYGLVIGPVSQWISSRS